MMSLMYMGLNPNLTPEFIAQQADKVEHFKECCQIVTEGFERCPCEYQTEYLGTMLPLLLQVMFM